MEVLKGKVGVVTGAASGIGLGIATALTAAGMRVVLSDIEREPLESATEQLRLNGAEVHCVTADVSQLQEVQRLADETLNVYGAVHVLCNNAGVTVDSRPSWKSTTDDWTWILGVNLLGVVHGVRTFLPILLKQKSEAHIVNTSSLAALIYSENTLYTTTKAAVNAFSESLYLELTRSKRNIGVSVLCPAYVNTNILQSARNRPGNLSECGPIPKGQVVDAMREWAQERIATGLDPEAVGKLVVDAITKNKFYIFTHPDWMRVVEERMHKILAGENPQHPIRPGDDTLARLIEHVMSKSDRTD